MKIRVRGIEMAYQDTGGNGIPLVLVHGFPLDQTLWSAQIKALGDVARVITPDLRGFGESSISTSPVTIETYADDVRALLDALGIKNAVIGGLSMGGYIALAFYRRSAARVRGLILANTRASADSAEGKKAREDNAALVRAKGVAEIAERMLPKLLTPQTIATQPALANWVRAMMARQSVAGVVAALMAMRDRPDSIPLLGQITVPTLIITGADDTLIPLNEAEVMRDNIRGAQLVVIPGAAHLSNVEQPAAFHQAIREFLKAF